MTTAARPTFEPARGGQGRGEKDLSAISKQYSSRDLPSHTKLKFREHGQGTTEELRSRDFRRELEEREHEKEKSSRRTADSRESKRPKLDQLPAASLDADDPLDEDDDSDENDSDDDTAALMAELNRIKKERAAENARKEAEKRQEEERIRMENILSGNPLLNYAAQATKTDIKGRGVREAIKDLQTERSSAIDVRAPGLTRRDPAKAFIPPSLPAADVHGVAFPPGAPIRPGEPDVLGRASALPIPSEDGSLNPEKKQIERSKKFAFVF